MERAKNAPAQPKLCKGVHSRGTTLFRATPHSVRLITGWAEERARRLPL